MDRSSLQNQSGDTESPIAEQVHGHMIGECDPDNPENWPLHRKLYDSSVSFAFAFVVAFGLTSYTAGISELPTRFDISMFQAILGFSLYLFGIAFAPIYTPHLSEKFGRVPVYMTSLPCCMLFVLGSSLARNFTTLATCRFFAGFFGGPCLVLIEGTFADIWAIEVTGTYYAFLTLASYFGAACGPLVGGFVFAATSWQWTQWVTLMLGLAVYLFGIGVPETYGRDIVRRRAKRDGVEHDLEEADSGVTVGQMMHITIFTPLKMLVTEPIVILMSVYLALNFAVLFQFFITVPIALSGTYNFSIQQVGLAFIAAIVGVSLAAVTTVILDRVTAPGAVKKSMETMTMHIEYRLYPAMIGCFFMPGSLFWIGWTVKPSISWASPVLGTMLYVWGSALVLNSFISYLFDAYPPRATLSALTAAACLRITLAGALPLVIIQMFTGLTPLWALSTFGFIASAMIPIPFLIFVYGGRLRARSKYAGDWPILEKKEKQKLTIFNAAEA